MAKDAPDPVMARVRDAFDRAGFTLDELGRRMGYQGKIARTSAWQFLNKTNDPRLSMLRKFAAAVGVRLSALIGD
jgi:transcriptional regulator with XRE-family HTH domain